MTARYLSEVLGPEALAAQQRAYGRTYRVTRVDAADALGEDEAAFIRERDSFYLATVTSNGWPYVQHRGGPAGFLQVLAPHRLGYADLRGNRQLISAGNIDSGGRIAMILVDYPRRERLKILGLARVLAASEDPALADVLAPVPELRARVERLVLIDVVGFDWNCAAYITPRYTAAEVERATSALHERIAQLEAKLQQA